MIVLLALFICVAMALTVSQVSAKNTTIKTQMMFPCSLPDLGNPMVWFSENVKKATNGEINFKLYDPPKLVPVMDILESVSQGLLGAGFAAPGFWMGKVPAAAIFGSVPFGPEGPEFISWLYYGNGLKLWQEAYDKSGLNLKVFPVLIVPPETSGWFTKKIEKVEDLKGFSMRFYGLGAAVIEKLGMSAAMLPPAEIFPAMEKGVVDAAEFSTPAVDESAGFYKIAKYNYYPGWHQQASIQELTINKDLWNKLEPHQQSIIELTAMASLINCIAVGEGRQGPVIKKNAEERGVNNVKWSPDLLAAFKQAWDKVVKERCAKDEMFKKVWEDLSKFREDYQTYKDFAFLPR